MHSLSTHGRALTCIRRIGMWAGMIPLCSTFVRSHKPVSQLLVGEKADDFWRVHQSMIGKSIERQRNFDYQSLVSIIGYTRHSEGFTQYQLLLFSAGGDWDNERKLVNILKEVYVWLPICRVHMIITKKWSFIQNITKVTNKGVNIDILNKTNIHDNNFEGKLVLVSFFKSCIWQLLCTILYAKIFDLTIICGCI